MIRIVPPLLRWLPVLLIATASRAQSPSFEVVSIKPSHSNGTTSTENTSPGRLNATNVTVAELIQFAFGIRDFQISGGPGWLRDDRFDLVATTAAPIALTDKLLESYLQSLLADRCRFRYRRETKELQAYSLVVAKNGPKLNPHPGDEESSTHEISHGPASISMSATQASMRNLAVLLNRELGRTVIDNTGLKGTYDFKLEWAPNPAPDSVSPSVFTALQEQLGLRLEVTKGPVEIIVIDNIGRPSEN